MAETQPNLTDLHKLVTTALIRELQKDDPQASVVSTAVRFLKDNGMTIDSEFSGNLEDLKRLLELEDEDLPYDTDDEEDDDDEDEVIIE